MLAQAHPDSRTLSFGRTVVHAAEIPSRNAPGATNVWFDHGRNVIAAVARTVFTRCRRSKQCNRSDRFYCCPPITVFARTSADCQVVSGLGKLALADWCLGVAIGTSQQQSWDHTQRPLCPR